MRFRSPKAIKIASLLRLDAIDGPQVYKLRRSLDSLSNYYLVNSYYAKITKLQIVCHSLHVVDQVVQITPVDDYFTKS